VEDEASKKSFVFTYFSKFRQFISETLFLYTCIWHLSFPLLALEGATFEYIMTVNTTQLQLHPVRFVHNVYASPHFASFSVEFGRYYTIMSFFYKEERLSVLIRYKSMDHTISNCVLPFRRCKSASAMD